MSHNELLTTIKSLLEDTQPLIVKPKLACEIGLNEAIILQQITYWVTNPAMRMNDKHILGGLVWIYNTIAQWQKQFPFFSKRTIQRAILSLESKALLISGCFNEKASNRTKWYTINPALLGLSIDIGTLCQLGINHSAKLASSNVPEWNDPSCQNGTISNEQRSPDTISENTTHKDCVVSDINCLERKAKMDELLKLGLSEAMVNRILSKFPITRIAEVIIMYHEAGANSPGWIVTALKEKWPRVENKMAPQASGSIMDDCERKKMLDEISEKSYLERMAGYK
jgi:hypothetical protein